MKIVNTNALAWEQWDSPGGKFRMGGKGISEALGRNPKSTDLLLRHPFDVEIQRIPAGAVATPFHSHSAQWEFYHVMSGNGAVRDETETTPIAAGDAFLFKPGEAHQIIAGDADLVMYVVADNPFGEHHYYPDSAKWGVGLPQRRLLRGEPLDYFDGEE